MEHGKRVEECLAYFTNTPILKKMLVLCVKKYKSFGTACGNVVLRALSLEEIEMLEGFTGKNYHGKKNISISVSVIQKAIDDSRFHGTQLDELLDIYNGGNLKSKKQEVEDENCKILNFYGRLRAEHESTQVGIWLKSVMERNDNLFKMLQKKYRDRVLNEAFQSGKAEEKLWTELNIWLYSVEMLPVFYNKYEYLSIFAATVSGDPHYYDEGKEYTLFLYYAIADILQLDKIVSSVMSAEKKHQLLYEAGLIKDNMSNDVMVYGIQAWREEGEHLGILGFWKEKEPLSLTLSTITHLRSVKGMGNCLYVVENPIVFAQIIKNENISALCVNGQPNLAVLLVLDLFVKEGGIIYYSGDFDPEGLLIAQRLKNRYEKSLMLWHYEKQDYHSAMSNKTVSEKRLSMLKALTSLELIQIGELLRLHKKAGYQEKINLDEFENRKLK